jgi:hypothetical protein
MGLYLCVFDAAEEVEGVEVGPYEDFNTFREAVNAHLEGGAFGSRFPTLMLHADSDGSWSPEEASRLESELETIADEFKKLPPLENHPEWRRMVARQLGLKPRNLYESFFDVDGEPLIDRLVGLCRTAQERQLPILFQ